MIEGVDLGVPEQESDFGQLVGAIGHVTKSIFVSGPLCELAKTRALGFELALPAAARASGFYSATRVATDNATPSVQVWPPSSE